jgi:peptidoglycan/xylan/chitin deacetylase (PgdA/CDA1 family)
MYHQVDAPAPHGSPLRGLTVSPAAFRRQMGLLKMLGYRGLSMGELELYLRGPLTGKVVGITFDDGYLNNLQHALPILQEFGFSATCYVVSNGVGGSNAWDHARGVAPKPLMNPDHLRTWVAAGQEIGAHSCDHVDLTALSNAAAEQQIGACKSQLEGLLDAPVRHFCYPYGRYDAGHMSLVQQAGYATATTTRRGRFHPGGDAGTRLLELPRVPVWRATTLPALWLKLATAYEDRKAPAE